MLVMATVLFEPHLRPCFEFTRHHDPADGVGIRMVVESPGKFCEPVLISDFVVINPGNYAIANSAKSSIASAAEPSSGFNQVVKFGRAELMNYGLGAISLREIIHNEDRKPWVILHQKALQAIAKALWTFPGAHSNCHVRCTLQNVRA
jgi:hypothetical protein